MEIYNSFDLLAFLKSKNLLAHCKNPMWWENCGSFQTIIEAILTQNTKWQSVEKSIINLKNAGILDLKKLANCDLIILSHLIKPSGFFNQKAARIKMLCENILREFGDFSSFKNRASRQWLLNQKGIGFESADSILNYGLFREIMVVDKYTQKLLLRFGLEFESYEDIQSWLMHGVEENLDKIYDLYKYEIPLYQIYGRFHAKIVEFSKNEAKNKY